MSNHDFESIPTHKKTRHSSPLPEEIQQLTQPHFLGSPMPPLHSRRATYAARRVIYAVRRVTYAALRVIYAVRRVTYAARRVAYAATPVAALNSKP